MTFHVAQQKGLLLSLLQVGSFVYVTGPDYCLFVRELRECKIYSSFLLSGKVTSHGVPLSKFRVLVQTGLPPFHEIFKDN